MFLNQLSQGTPEELPPRKFWFPIPEDKPDVAKMNQNEQRLHDEILKLQKAEKLDPNKSEEDEKKFRSNFIWEGSIPNAHERRRIEKLPIR